MLRIYVVGRFTGTAYGPFWSEAAAQSFIRVELRSTNRQYETVAEGHSDSAVLPAIIRRAIAPKGLEGNARA